MTEYTPTTGEVRSLYKSGAWLMTDRAPNRFDREKYEGVLFGEFDRWLNEIRAEAWTEGFDKGFYRGQILHGDYDASEAGIENPYEVV